MNAYTQHKWSYAIHIVRGTTTEGIQRTMCGRWYHPKLCFTPDLCSKRKEDVVCAECRRIAAWWIGKKVYHRPRLKYGLSEAKRRKLLVLRRHDIELERLKAWNEAAMR